MPAAVGIAKNWDSSGLLWIISKKTNTKNQNHERSTMTDCLFCKIRDGEIPGDKVYEDDDILAFRDVNPQAPTHVLVIPKKHIATINDLDNEDVTVSGKMMLVAKQIAADEGIDQDGYRLVFNCNEGAGQAVFHIHMHVLGGRRMSWPPG